MNYRFPLSSSIASALVLLAPLGASAQESFPSSNAAMEALASSVEAADTARTLRILGPGAEDVAFSGDAVADINRRQDFLDAYAEGHRIRKRGEDAAILLIGEQGWPFPIPLAKRAEGWQFNTAQGKKEILARRIGRNELRAINLCLAYIYAQRDYASYAREHMGIPAYAQRFFSRPGKQDGLFWPATAGQPQSPIGTFVDFATSEGYKFGGPERKPFRGYYYRILTKQGRAAPGGPRNYIVQGQMIGGFALLAWPAQYGNSGIMTFTVNQDGVVYQQDLGPDTALRAERITHYNPDVSWQATSVPVKLAED